MTTLNDGVRHQREAVLGERYRPGSGPVLLTGVQAIARLLAEQHERDRRAGTRTATFVSGYQGSPLGGLDRMLADLPELRTDHDVHLQPGMNEELGATAVWGSQLELPSGARTHDGVIGVWYGKGPGLDRATDSLRHAAMYGAHPKGGALILVGDDPAAKSSTIPAASEKALAAMNMPIVFPRNADEVIRFGMYAIELSRLSGCFVGMKIVADVADGLWTFARDLSDFTVEVPSITWQGRPWTYRQRICSSPPDSLLAEADLYGPRWMMVEAFNAANPFDTVEVDPPHATVGIVAVGTGYDSTRQALTDLGVGESELLDNGIRVLRVGMPFPLGADTVRRFAEGLDTILVVEDKTPFVEQQLKEILYGTPDAPAVLGKRDRRGRALVPIDGELTAARLRGPLRRYLGDRMTLAPAGPAQIDLGVLPVKRSAYFCSGCPHNRSTAVPDGSLAGGGIGCHTMVTMSPRTDSQVVGITQMGGEGAQWIGQAPFTDVDHIFQNIGDGTYFHSGQLAVQAAVAAGVNITYKILYNSAVAMTGAQHAEAALSVPQLTHKLRDEGVGRIIVCSDEPGRHRRSAYAHGVTVWDRDRLDEAQRILRTEPGVTALIYDQPCAADKRRKRKRGQVPEATTKVVINEAVCEGCGDCGVKSNCLSVQPIATEFGTKTRIDQTSCNTDYSCLDGTCPAFVTVTVGEEKPKRRTAPRAPEVDEPSLRPIVGLHNTFLAGIGGTGIVTVNQILGMAALRSGLHVDGLDQTGLSQKAGPVTSHLRLSPTDTGASNRIGPNSADCVLAFDMLTAADSRYVDFGRPGHTITVASTGQTPTGPMVYDRSIAYPATDSLADRLRARCDTLVGFDALGAAEALFGATAAANFLLVGAAYQAGGLPIPRAAILEAIALNGVAVAANTSAFEWGRVAVADPDAFRAAVVGAEEPAGAARTVTVAPAALLAGRRLPEAVRAIAERRAGELVGYQDERVAAGYLATVEAVADAEARSGTGRTEFSEAVARLLFTVTAYKDEYEVARLLTDPAFAAHLDREVPQGGAHRFMLQPPTLAKLGRRKKIAFGPASHGVLRNLAHGKRLRGTRLDPFGRTPMRALERTLRDHYRLIVLEAARDLTAESYDRAVRIAEAVEVVKGYEEVKLRNVDTYLGRLNELGIDAAGLREALRANHVS
ncbi:indolepyruvate ferredoxin oxidoreductase family protein [Millisia brevis]|uniref:indolepyruvate ferredoxin oxidoreductase family protein n=1 Tax=Millisia brevis TaxID=264148 RepID=UPI000829D44B|nr:indolepyruvate ferredoxin oxidoreductase family protein [Millisia brevis]